MVLNYLRVCSVLIFSLDCSVASNQPWLYNRRKRREARLLRLWLDERRVLNPNTTTQRGRKIYAARGTYSAFRGSHVFLRDVLRRKLVGRV